MPLLDQRNSTNALKASPCSKNFLKYSNACASSPLLAQRISMKAPMSLLPQRTVQRISINTPRRAL